jgi:hypothetical protein
MWWHETDNKSHRHFVCLTNAYFAGPHPTLFFGAKTSEMSKLAPAVSIRRIVDGKSAFKIKDFFPSLACNLPQAESWPNWPAR